MSDRFLDRVLQFMGIQDEEEDENDELAATEDDDEGDDEEQETPERQRRRGRLVSLPARESAAARERGNNPTAHIAAVPGPGLTRWRMAVLEPESFNDVQAICDHLKEKRPVIVSVEGLDKELSKRIIDFVSGTTYAIDGHIQRVGESIFVFAPNGVQIEAVMRTQWEDINE